ncbi:penicillin-binding protein 1A [Granulicella mallensis]|uniref:Penicillin-binding protein, 1A family n=1 Tax=Granulicella mallensis (strain ATCC BAA-1857 / DSM 23137 / MP5ACTX8) TaxID=682795 RepID=G8NUI9_GRAMM|nr:PBP1A family penicillin-binding protein [Granulicella mallensis]AEU36440.1 penicillin-binding protein, 1A family [Granulicella mallensis MP5ACTX8]
MPSPLNSEGKKLSKPSASDTRRSDDRSALWRAMRTFPFREPEYRSRRVAGKAAFLLLLGASAIFGIMVGLLLVYSINLPQMADLERYRPSTTTELYDIHGKVFGSFALERRVVVPYSDFPPVLRDAILSIEDKDFESNSGINMIRMVGAAWHDMHSARRSQGASTLTMQLARNLFLSSEKTYGRKVQEIFLTLQIERHFTKSQIFTLYANQIYLGRGTYGFEAGSEYYFSKHVRDLTLSEAALLAALPKGPESYSPVRFPDRALKRRNLVLSEMFSDHKITAVQAEAAKAEPLGLHLEAPANIEAPYFVEEVRRQLEAEYGVDEVHGAGLRVYTTLDLDLQHVAEKSVLDGTAAYERRHGWKGRLQNVMGPDGDLDSYKHADWTQPFIDGAYFHALVVSVSATKMVVKIGQQLETMTTPDWAWTATFKATDLVQVGDIVYVKVIAPAGGTPRVVLEQDSGAQASMMAMDNANGEVLAMVGGRDFAISQFNRATQAQRQVGSSFKPYVYTAAFEAGAKPYDTIVDGPTSFYTPNGPYTPHNYEANFRGTMTLIDAFAESRNIPALKLADRVGIKKVIEVAHRFGITSNMPNFLPVAIGAADISLAEQVAAYSVFPNDGIRIAPHYIRKVSQADGLPLEQKTPEVKEVISLETARQMMLLLQSVVQQGTAAAASQMKHAFGGKTGTTNSYTDAWFIGFSPSVTCGTWIGFDNRQTLGDKETGAKAALPMWMDFMKVAVAGRPNEQFSKFNAPKKQLEVPMAQPSVEQAKPAHRDEDTDDDTDKTQSAPSPVPSNDTPDDDAPAKPAAKGPAKASSKTHVVVRSR